MFLILKTEKPKNQGAKSNMQLNPIFKNGVIFPADRAIRVFGESGEDVKITFLNQTKRCSPENGKFLIEFPPQGYGGPYFMTIESGNEKIVIEDIYVGIVLFMCGQSNMMFKIKEETDCENDFASDDLLRMHVCDHIIFFDGELERFRSSDGWLKCRKSEVGDWSAIAYRVGAELRKKLGVAVGLVCAYQGASVIESWLPDYAVNDPSVIIDEQKKHFDHHYEFYRLWNENSRLYNFVIKQIIPFSLSATVWYQGESDTTEEEGKIYDKELELFALSLRKGFKNAEMPFVVVQIADLDCRNDDGWRAIQNAQERAVKNLKNAYLVVSKDVCDTFTIHPPKKKLLADRISETLNKILQNKQKN